MGYRNLYLVDNVSELSGVSHDNDIGVVRDDLSSIYIIDSGTPTQVPIGPTLPVSWPVGILATFIGEKDPADLLGFGKWECIKKEEIGTDVAYSWKRVE